MTQFKVRMVDGGHMAVPFDDIAALNDWMFYQSLCRYLSDPLVDCDSSDDENADQQERPLRIRTHKAQTQGEHANDQRPE